VPVIDLRDGQNEVWMKLRRVTPSGWDPKPRDIEAALAGLPLSYPEPPPMPEPWGVLYMPPRADGAGRRCGNCMMWAREKGGRCQIHARSLQVPISSVCGYHVSGDPMAKRVEPPGLDPVLPQFSGLDRAPRAGTSCANCRHFAGPRPGTGNCMIVQRPGRKPGVPALVHSQGCCAAWEAL
jgi:hypothetical protein